MRKEKIYAAFSIFVLLINFCSGTIFAIENIKNSNNISNETIENEINSDVISNEIIENEKDLNSAYNETNVSDSNNIYNGSIIENDINNVDNNITNSANSNDIVENKILNDKSEEIIRNEEILTLSEEEQKTLGVQYRTHVQDIGWQNYVENEEIAGTQGKSLRLEGINIKLVNNTTNLKIKYQVHVQNIGWQEWKSDNEMAGTQGLSYRLEAIKIKLEESDDYSVMYRVHIQNIGWQEWKIDDEIAGTQGQSLRLEAIQIKIVPKVKKGKVTLQTALNGQVYYNPQTIKVVGWKMANVCNTKIMAYIDNSNTPIDENLITYKKRNDVLSAVTGYGTERENPNPGFEFSLDSLKMTEGTHKIKIVLCTFNGEIIEQVTNEIKIDRDLHIQYRAHVQEIGWQEYVKDGAMAGTSGKSYRVEALNISLINAPENAKILYRTHVQNIGWQNWQQNGAMAGTSGKSYRVEAIEIVLENMDEYTVEYQVHIQDKGWTDWYMDGETAGTVGQEKRIEAIRIRLVAKKEKRSYKGIDVSVYNGSINWGFVKRDGIDFAFIRAGFRGYGSRGTLNEDPYFKLNMQGAKQAGIPVGVYFVTQAITAEEAIQEANWVIEKVKNYNIDYPIAIDIEAPGLENPNDIPRTQNLDKNTRTYLAKLFCQTIQSAGYTPIIYCNVDWAYNYLNMSELSEYDTWIASYRDNNPGYNGKYSIWQYTSNGQVNGVLGYVDRNICYKKY